MRAMRWNHYEAAFEQYLRNRCSPHVVVDEKRRSLIQNSSLKSFDFIVYSQQKFNLLVDIKGRKFPSGGEQNKNLWENWATEDDMNCLMQWQDIFGEGFRSLLVFAYEILEPKWIDQFKTVFSYQNRNYSFFGVWADEYETFRKTRSQKWQTVTISKDNFMRLKEPIDQFLD